MVGSFTGDTGEDVVGRNVEEENPTGSAERSEVRGRRNVESLSSSRIGGGNVRTAFSGAMDDGARPTKEEGGG